MVAKGVHLIHEPEEVQYSMLQHLSVRCRTADKYMHVVAWVLMGVKQFQGKGDVSTAKTAPERGV